MRKGDVIKLVREHLDDLRTFGVSRLSLFGSVSRDTASPESDVDFIVEFDRPLGLFEFFRLQHYLEELLDVDKVDLITPGAIKPALKTRILSEAVDVA
ncbi:MAG: nucleotidyltransferase family protein [Verrucomicrobia bacterium]|nr:nucleotidyltransferase family protein [Verrucomicrobiota bacterium]